MGNFLFVYIKYILLNENMFVQFIYSVYVILFARSPPHTPRGTGCAGMGWAGVAWVGLAGLVGAGLGWLDLEHKHKLKKSWTNTHDFLL